MTVDFTNLPQYIRNELDNGGKTIQRPENGQRAKRVQEWLKYHDCGTGIDGKFGPATASCVKAFQKKKKLAVTGTVNKKTWDALVAPMRAVLQRPKGIERLTPQKALRKVAQQHLKQRPVELGDQNSGPWVRLYCSGHDGRKYAWCAGFVSLIMKQAYFYLDEKTPIKGSLKCDVLAAQAKDAGLFVPERDITSGTFAWDDFGGTCIFLKRKRANDWVHTGYAFSASGPPEETTFTTIEGNTNVERSREGVEACELTRSVHTIHYDFIALT